MFWINYYNMYCVCVLFIFLYYASFLVPNNNDPNNLVHLLLQIIRLTSQRSHVWMRLVLLKSKGGEESKLKFSLSKPQCLKTIYCTSIPSGSQQCQIHLEQFASFLLNMALMIFFSPTQPNCHTPQGQGGFSSNHSS